MCPASEDHPNSIEHGGAALRRLSRATAIAAVALAGASGVPAAARASEPIPLPGTFGGIGDLAVDPDGGLRVATVDFDSGESHVGARLTYVNSLGVAQPALDLLPEAPLQTFAETSLTSTGSLVSYGTLRKPHPRVRVFDVAADGKRSRAVTVSDKAHAARLIGDTVTGGGAVAVMFDQHLGGGRWEPRIAYRPAGATAFLPSFATGPARRSARTDYFPVVLGPDGSGVVISEPNGAIGSPGADFTARRLSADGTLGPAIVVAPRSIGIGAMKASVGPTGTVVFALGTGKELPANSPEDEGKATEDLWATTLPAGADHVTPLQHLATADNDRDVWPDIDLTVGANDRAALIADLSAPERLVVFEGSATALAQTGSFAGTDATPDDARIAFDAQGGVTAAWSARIGSGSASLIVAAHRGAGAATFSAPRPVTRATTPGAYLRALEPVPGGDAAIVYGELGDDAHAGGEYVLRFTP